MRIFILLVMTLVAPAAFAVTVQIPNGVSTTGYIEAVSASGAWIATQAEAEAGVDDTQVMTPLKTKYAIAAQAASSASGAMDATFVASGTEQNNTANATFSGLSFGAAATDRYMVAVVTGALVNGGAAFQVATTTIGGVTATKLHEVLGTHTGVSFWMARVPTGTSGNVAITITQNTNYKTVALYRLTGMNEGVRATGSAAVGGTTQSLSLNIPRNGTAIYGAVCGLISGGGTTTWSGANENFDTMTASNNIHTAASVAAASLSLNYSASQTWSASCSYATMGGVAFY